MDGVYKTASHGPTNALIGILFAVYLAVVMFQGNLVPFLGAVKDDFLGSDNQPAFWKWFLALLILFALAQSPRLNFMFGPLLVIVIVALLIELAQNHPGLWQNITANLQSVTKL
jgi:hypothetical protein